MESTPRRTLATADPSFHEHNRAEAHLALQFRVHSDLHLEQASGLLKSSFSGSLGSSGFGV